MSAARTKSLHVAVTGAIGYLGRLVLPRLLASPRVAKVLALDLAAPEAEDPRLSFAATDLSRSDSARELTTALRDFRADVVVHLAFFTSPVRDAAFAHEVEVAGTGQVLTACAGAGVRRLVMSSTTLVYGASATNPNFLDEDRPLPERAPSPFVADKIEAEQQVRAFRRSHPDLRSVVLRFAPLLGPTIQSPITRYLGGSVAPVLLGHDPLVQCVHEDDAADAVVLAVGAEASGDYNVCGRGVVPLSAALRLSGARALPLPLPMARLTLEGLNATGFTAVPPHMLDYLRFLWVADGSRAERDLGFKPRYGTREALLSFAQARRAGPV